MISSHYPTLHITKVPGVGSMLHGLMKGKHEAETFVQMWFSCSLIPLHTNRDGRDINPELQRRRFFSRREQHTITIVPYPELHFRKHLKHQVGWDWSCSYHNPKEGSAPTHNPVHCSQLISVGTFIKWTGCYLQPFLSMAELWQKPHSQKCLVLTRVEKILFPLKVKNLPQL